VNNRFSICDGCLQADDDDGIEFDRDEDEDENEGWTENDEDELSDMNGGEDQFLDSYMEDRMSGGGDF
jgi:hypothetical protein